VNLTNTLECGQFFQWTRERKGYRVRSHGKVFRAAQIGDALKVEGADETFARHFFAADHDDEAISRELRRDPIVRRAMDAVPGIRILRQDPYECTIGFIVSICSNIPRITGNVRSIAERYGSGEVLPGPEVILREGALRKLGVGFRARYLVSAQKNARLLTRIPALSDDEARET
jgi:N-glycosylase/DNA lyase